VEGDDNKSIIEQMKETRRERSKSNRVLMENMNNDSGVDDGDVVEDGVVDGGVGDGGEALTDAPGVDVV